MEIIERLSKYFRVPDHLGGCPICGCNGGYRNIQKSHFCFCEKHKKVWSVGWNLFSSWRYEDEDTWKRNDEFLSEFEPVEPFMHGLYWRYNKLKWWFKSLWWWITGFDPIACSPP